jgi:hypothetical protein
MMAAFTDAQTLAGVIPVAMTPFAALPTTTPALVPDESTSSTATTPPSSPAHKRDYFGPCTPTSTSTPLHRRFLRSISMSPAIPSPSTPTRYSPAKAQGRATPAHRKSESPIKLEVGQNAFYFSIELPTSKITPKKTGTPTSKATTPRDAGQETPTKPPTVKELAARYQETDLGTPTKRSSPLKNANSVKDDPATPTRRTRSPAKNPRSIDQSPARPLFDTPKSHQTPDTGSGTPTRRTTSPLKSHSLVKRSPARALFGTLTKKSTARASVRPGSPIKRAIERLPTEPEKKVSKLAEKLLSKPTETPKVAPECLTDVTEEDPSRMATNTSAVTSVAQVDPLVETARAAAKVRPENIRHLMANLGSTKIPTIHAEDANRLSASPAPTPLCRASQRLGLAEFPSFVRLSTNRASGETNGDVKAAGSSTSYQEANDRQQEDKQTGTTSPEPAGGITTIQTTATQTVDQDHRTVNVSHEAQPMHLRRADPGLSNAFDMPRNDQTPQYQYPPLLFPKPEPEPAPVAKQNVLQPPSEEHMQRQEMDASKVQRQSPSAQHRRIGTDPSVILKMQEEMANLEATMRRSAGVVDANFCGPLNLNELPAMSNSFFSSRRDPSDVRSPGAIGSSRTLSRTNSTTSSIEMVRASMVMSAQNRPQLTTRVSSTPKIPRWKPSGPTPAQTKREKLMAAKQMRSEKMSGPGTPRSRPSSVASGTSSKTSTKATAMLRDTDVSPTVHKSPSLTRIPNSPTSRIPSTTPMKFKISTTAVPTSAQNPTLNPSTPKVPAPALTRRLSRLKSPQSTPQLRGPARSIMAPQPYTPWVDRRPSEKKFASAVDIASRLKEWHEEDRKRAEAKTLRSKIPVMTPPKAAAKTPTRISTKTEVKQSYTPEGSPTKLLTPIIESKTTSPPKPRRLSSNSNLPSTPKAELAPTSKPTVAPKTPLPKTSAARNPALARLKHSKTPANRRTSTLDRNATRTPSKAIVSSLDKAIDEKIAEDARSGREFTPSGNRVADLLDARGKGR